MSTTRLVAVAILFFAAPLWADEATDTFNRLYGNELEAAQKSKGASVALAAKMLEAAKEAEANPPLLALLCEKACELGAQDPKGYDTVLAAADLLSSNIPEKAAACRERVLMVRQQQYAKARSDDKVKTGEALLDALLSTACDKAQDGNFDDALKRCRQALTVAKSLKSPNAEGIDAHIKHLTGQQKVAGKVPQLKEDLKADPANRDKRGELIRLLLVELDNPEEAAKYVDDKCDADVQKYVPAAAKGVDLAPEMACPALANWYLGLSQAKDTSPGGKACMLTRAKAYCERFLAVHTQEDKERSTAAVTLKKVEADLKALGGAAWAPPVKMLGRGQWVDLLGLVDPKKDCVTGTWGLRDGDFVVISGIALKASRFQVPLALSGNYEAEIKFSQPKGTGNEFAIILPVGDTWTVLSIQASGAQGRYGIGCVYDKGPEVCGGKPVQVAGPRIEADRVYTILVRVQVAGSNGRISATLDGGPLCAWAGDWTKLTVFSDYALANPKCLGFAERNFGPHIKSARLRMLSGGATPLRPPDAKAAPVATPQPPK